MSFKAGDCSTFGNNTLAVGKIWVTGKDDGKYGSMGRGPLGESTDQVVARVATLK